MAAFTCPHCKQTIKFEAKQVGMPAVCPHCDAVIEFPDNSLLEQKKAIVYDGQDSSSSRLHSRLLRMSLSINLFVLAAALILGALFQPSISTLGGYLFTLAHVLAFFFEII